MERPRPVVLAAGAGSALPRIARGEGLMVGVHASSGRDDEVAPLHVHDEDDEAWIVLEGSLRFRFDDGVSLAPAGSVVLVPAGVPHTWGPASVEPVRYAIIAPRRLDRLIERLHETGSTRDPEIYRQHGSELLE